MNSAEALIAGDNANAPRAQSMLLHCQPMPPEANAAARLAVVLTFGRKLVL